LSYHPAKDQKGKTCQENPVKHLSFHAKVGAPVEQGFFGKIRFFLTLRCTRFSTMERLAPVRIDAHQHFWHYQPEAYPWIGEEMNVLKHDFLPPDLVGLLGDAEMNGSLCVQARSQELENDFLLDLCKNYSFLLGVVGWVDLCHPKVHERLLHYRSKPGMKGFRHGVQDEKDPRFMLRPAFLDGIRALLALNFRYDILVYAHQLPQVLAFLEHFPDMPFMLDHLAKPPIRSGTLAVWQEYMRRVAAFPRVMVKVSGMVTEADWQWKEKEVFYPWLDALVEAFGSERLCYGSDWPVCQLAGGYARQHHVVTSYFQEFSLEEREKVMGHNAADFYQL